MIILEIDHNAYCVSSLDVAYTVISILRQSKCASYNYGAGTGGYVVSNKAPKLSTHVIDDPEEATDALCE